MSEIQLYRLLGISPSSEQTAMCEQSSQLLFVGLLHNISIFPSNSFQNTPPSDRRDDK